MNRQAVYDSLNKARTIVKLGKVYRHYKGGLYRVVDIVLCEKTLEPMVVYQDIINMNLTWVRNFDDFRINVSDNGDTVPRFSLID